MFGLALVFKEFRATGLCCGLFMNGVAESLIGDDQLQL
jgi:hypothetical protein